MEGEGAEIDPQTFCTHQRLKTLANFQNKSSVALLKMRELFFFFWINTQSLTVLKKTLWG